MTVFAAACAKGLRDESVQAHQKAATEEREDNENVGAEADSAHSSSAIGKAADHHGVHDSHAHPAEFGEDERNGEPQSGAELGAKCVECEHVKETRGTSVSGAERRRKPARAW